MPTRSAKSPGRELLRLVATRPHTARERLLKELAAHGGNISATARALGARRCTVGTIVRQLGIHHDRRVIIETKKAGRYAERLRKWSLYGNMSKAETRALRRAEATQSRPEPPPPPSPAPPHRPAPKRRRRA